MIKLNYFSTGWVASSISGILVTEFLSSGDSGEFSFLGILFLLGALVSCVSVNYLFFSTFADRYLFSANWINILIGFMVGFGGFIITELIPSAQVNFVYLISVYLLSPVLGLFSVVLSKVLMKAATNSNE